MKVYLFKEYEDMSMAAAEKIVSFVNEKPNALLCLAAGNTPVSTFEILVNATSKKAVDFSRCKFVGLDEWVGLGKEDFGSCQETLYRTFFLQLGIKEENICFFDAKAKNLKQECERIDNFISDNEHIDLMVLGIGVNGHLGFNEPGVALNCFSHVVDLDDKTISVGQKYFNSERKLKKGITLGIQQIIETNTVILIANGWNKANAVDRMLNGNVTNEIPASILQIHRDCFVYLDEQAASLMS